MTEDEKEEVMNMLYKYKEAFSLRDKIGLCPNIEVGIKVMDKRVVTDFRHLNVRITKNNLAYPLVRDTFSVLGNSKCKVLLVLDLKDAFHS